MVLTGAADDPTGAAGCVPNDTPPVEGTAAPKDVPDSPAAVVVDEAFGAAAIPPNDNPAPLEPPVAAPRAG